MSEKAVLDFIGKIDSNAQLREEFYKTMPAKVSSGTPVVQFATKHGYQFTEQELATVSTKLSGVTELSDAETSAVVGGAGVQRQFTSPLTRNFSNMIKFGGEVAM